MRVRYLAPAREEAFEAGRFYEEEAAGLGSEFYSLIYEVHDDHILVVAVAHHRRRPGYWRERRGS